MASEHDAPRIAAIFGDLLFRPRDGSGAVLNEIWKHDVGDHTIVRDHDGEPARGERAASEGVIFLVPAAPGAAIEEYDDRRISAPGGIDVQRTAGPCAIAYVCGHPPGVVLWHKRIECRQRRACSKRSQKRRGGGEGAKDYQKSMHV